MIKKMICLILCLILIFTTCSYILFNMVEKDKFNIQIQYSLHEISDAIRSKKISRTITLDDWTTFQFDHYNSGNSTSNSPITNKTLWKFNDNGNQKGEIYSSPIVANDYVYFSTSNGYLYSVDRKTGNKKWSFDLQKDTYGTPTYSNGYIYVGTGTEYENTENYLYRINANNGSEDSKFRITLKDSAILGAPLIIDKPGVLEDRLYFGTLKNNTIFSYNISSNPPELDWFYELPNATKYSNDGIWSSFVYYNLSADSDLLLFTTNSDSIGTEIPRGIFCMNTDSGKELWRFPKENSNYKFQTYSSPTIFYDNSTQKSNVLFGAGIEYGTSPNEGKLYCIDISTGIELWNFTTGDGPFGYGVSSSPAVAYEKIFFGACDGKLYAVDFNGKKLWDYQTGDTSNGIYSSPAIANGCIYFGSTDRNFYCLEINNGSLIWRFNTEKDSTSGNYGVTSSPAIANNRVFVGSCNGFLYCFGREGSKPPKVMIEGPKDNDMVNGTVEIFGIAEDDISVLAVQIRIDDSSWLNASGKEIWSYLWNTSDISDGLHKVFVRVFDETGFSIEDISVIVNNVGSEIFIQITSHTNGQEVIGLTKLKGIARHNLDLDFEVQVKIDERSPWITATGSKNWNFYWNTDQYMDGEYYVQIRGFDGFINSTPIGIILRILNKIEPIVPGNYPMFRTDYNRSGATTFKVPIMGAEIWNFSAENTIESSAVYFNKRIYFGANDWYVYCLDSETSKLFWKFETSGGVRSSPTIANQRLYIGSQDYYLYCLNVESGELIWKFKTSGSVDSSSLVVGEYVIFGSYDGKVYALDNIKGDKKWVFDTSSEIWGSPVYYDNCVYIGSRSGRLHCIWVNNGTERWNSTTNQIATLRGIYSTPLIVSDKVIFGSEDNILYCLNATNGKRIWMFKTTGPIYSSAAVNLNKVFFTSLEENNKGILYALPIYNPNQGNLLTPSDVIWNFTTHDFDGGSSPTVSLSSGMVLIGSNDGDSGGTGKVFCLDEGSGAEIWNFTTNNDVHGTPIVANNKVYIGSLDGSMYCLGVNYSDVNETELKDIKIDINIPTESMFAGEKIENITITAFSDNKPLPRTRFNINVTSGSLSFNYGTSTVDGKFLINYYAPKPELVKENLSVTLSVEGVKTYYKAGYGTIDFIVISILGDNNNTNNETPNGNGEPKPDNNDTANNKSEKDNGTGFIIIAVVVIVVVIILIIAVELKVRKKKT